MGEKKSGGFFSEAANKSAEHLPFLLFLTCILIVGLFVSGNYGEAADDDSLQIYADHTFAVYQTFLTRGEFLDPAYDILSYYGPAFVTAIRVGQAAIPGLDPLQTWHIFTFFSFLVGIIALYDLALNLFPKPVALAICILYTSQPLLWGQGMLNAKDTPLSSFILLSIAAGVKLASLFPDGSWQTRNWWKDLKREWKANSKNSRKRFTTEIRVFIISTTLVAVSSFFWNGWLLAFLGWLASADANTWLGKIFISLAPNAASLPLEGYADKAALYLSRAALSVGAIGFLYLLIKGSGIFAKSIKRTFSAFTKNISPETGRLLRSSWVWIAAIPVGISTAIRVIGPFGAGLVILFLIWKRGPKSIAILLPYLLISALVTYMLWPYLWEDPVTRFIESIRVMRDFPWQGRVLFEGDLFRPQRLPFYYLPKLLGIQLTIPALILALAGMALAIRNFLGRHQAMIAILLLWIFTPMAYIIINKPIVYHNFRQFLFIVPPLFFFAGFALTWLNEKIKRNVLFWGVIILAVIPGIAAIVQLHPYEYVYYNEFVGGLRGVDGKYEIEYWRTSLTEATRQLNEIAPTNSLVESWGSAQIVQHAARPDMHVELLNARTYDSTRPYDYVLVPIRGINGRYLFGGFPEIINISRMGVSFAVVNQLNCCATLDPSPPSIFD